MARISRVIDEDIARLKESKEAVAHCLQEEERLQSCLHTTRNHLRAVPLAFPRLVCAHNECIEIKDGTRGIQVVRYRSVCQEPCFLPTVQADVMAHPEILRCEVFGRGTSKNCLKCGHHWQNHLHVVNELEETSVTTIDQNVAWKLRMNADERQLRETVQKEYERLVNELESERTKLRETAAQCSVFLTRSTANPHDDFMLGYMDFNIEEEQRKVHAGGSHAALKRFQTDRNQYTRAVQTLIESARAGMNYRVVDQDGVHVLIDELFDMKHFGPDLREAAHGFWEVESGSGQQEAAPL